MAKYIYFKPISKFPAVSRPSDRIAPLQNPKSDIRVLDLHPARRRDDDLYGRLRVVPLSKAPDYEALSYTWGVEKPEGSESNDSTKLAIAPNLSHALRRLRRQHKVRTLWVDAICIDQFPHEGRSRKEKESQIAIMGDIYKQATGALIWLGEYPNAQWKDVWHTRSPHWKSSNRLNARGRKFTEALDAALAATDSKWHDRAWVVQEFVLARAAKLCFGPICVPFDKVYLKELALHDPRPLENFRAFFRRITDMALLQYGVREDGMQSIREAVLYVSTASCTKDSDKVYSLLSLVDTREAKLIPVNYDQPSEQVFATATFASVSVQKSLAMLELVDLANHSKINNMPSWAINFTSEQDPTDGQLHAYVNHGIRWNEIQDAPTTPSASLSSDMTQLTVTGFALDVVHDVLELPSGIPSQYGQETAAFAADLARSIPLWHQQIYRSHESHSGQLRRKIEDVTTSDVFFPGDSMRTQLGTIVDAAFEVWDDIVRWAASRDAVDFKPYWKCSEEEKWRRTGLDSDSSSVMKYADFFSRGVQMFVTRRGKLGIGPTTFKSGNRIMMLVNSPLPIVLSPSAKSGQHFFRGFVWLHDDVNGKAKECVNQRREERIVLC